MGSLQNRRLGARSGEKRREESPEHARFEETPHETRGPGQGVEKRGKEKRGGNS